MKLTEELREKLNCKYDTDTLEFFVKIPMKAFSQAYLNKLFGLEKDSIQRPCLFINDKACRKTYAIPYFYTLSYPILTSIIDSFIMNEEIKR